MEHMFLDVCLDSVSSIHLKSLPGGQDLVDLLLADTDLLNTLVTSRASLILERIPVLQQRLASITSAIAHNATPTVSAALAQQLSECASALQRFVVYYIFFDIGCSSYVFLVELELQFIDTRRILVELLLTWHLMFCKYFVITKFIWKLR
jgi:hypothetical protein